MKLFWRLFSNAGSEAAARKHFARARERAGLAGVSPLIEPYHKGGFTISFTTRLQATAWAEQVLEALAHAQRLGRAWQIFGDIQAELNAWSNEVAVAGIDSAHVQSHNTQIAQQGVGERLV
jgi:hypothetical protein